MNLYPTLSDSFYNDIGNFRWDGLARIMVPDQLYVDLNRPEHHDTAGQERTCHLVVLGKPKGTCVTCFVSNHGEHTANQCVSLLQISSHPLLRMHKM